ncbi:OLC1v1020245C1 [Oldenlandia corymbosa var. corymbosa]|uniref:OLC1v1020245C1 n=1 Tax=Oldenlandia corymbosa var. corymbosa TaxID=529605 RepID=A0AAV1EG61_OLDCO|nr:OLC1v1020245C1 [Oldenlandia corymbosa var. corymbosa]
MSYSGFGRQSGPLAPIAQNPFAKLSQKPSPPPPLARSPRQSPSPGTGPNVNYRDYDALIDEGPPTVTPFTASSNFSNGFPARASPVQDIRSGRSPPPLFSDKEKIRNSKTVKISRAGILPNSQNRLAPELNGPSLSPFQRNSYPDVAQQSTLHSPAWREQLTPSTNFTTQLAQPFISPVQTTVNNDPRRRSPVQYSDLHAPKRSRSPVFPPREDGSSGDFVIASQNPQRPSASPPKMRSSNNFAPPGPQSHQQPQKSGDLYNGEVSANKPVSSPVAKKVKFPSSSRNDQVLVETSNIREDEADRELQAKAKRLMRFKNELSRETESDLGFKNQKAPAKRHYPVVMAEKKVNGEDAADVMGDSFNGNAQLPDNEDGSSSGIIVGLCLDMCPESERGERERKGDLDQFERLDGDRNQTSKSLAVKKYTRTAEREADLIRPMPVLESTMDYLLGLLNQSYDDRFLGLYNFLWDRMRAIRMDLRMQHIFGIGAIKMLEQMIRLHIVAMHELCEYTKGEGFSEGFDAHLNIEQMNKTSVELFQLYDDHRKKGTNVVTEKEFRGYYALLKLDKHPGYKVEPSELSLDLAKMTPNIRQTPEVMFARDVARARRTCNYIAFFNLARKASYLQACLMHAHFAKLRTQALAALHSGLQNNQGIPVSQVAAWLGMEEENIEDLLEYHGFTVKEFEVPYMVKEGTFLNVDNDYPVKCSKLVNEKRSGSIKEDVSYPRLAQSPLPQDTKLVNMSKGVKRKPMHTQPIDVGNHIQENDEDMLDYVPSPRADIQVTPTPKIAATQGVVIVDQPSPVSPRLWVPSTHDSPSSPGNRMGSERKFKFDSPFRNSFGRNAQVLNDSPSSPKNRMGSERKFKFDSPFRNSFGRNAQVQSERIPLEIIPSSEVTMVSNITTKPTYPVPVDSVPELSTIEGPRENDIDHDEEVMADEVETYSYDQEVAEAKLKLILRIWKRLAWKKRELREQKELAANAALNSLLLGPPILHLDMLSKSPVDFDLDRVMSERYEIQEESLSSLNASEVVAAQLSAKNPDAKCLCWKIILVTQDSTYGKDAGGKKKIPPIDVGSWLLSKLLPAGVNDENSGDLLVSSPSMAIWNKWLPSQSGDDTTCCLTIIKDVESTDLKDSVAGASAIIFPVSDSIPWEHQRNQLHNVLMDLPHASSLPLLVVTGLCEGDLDSSIIEKLGLHDIERTCISNVLVSFLKTHQTDQFNGFYSDERLREGLQWLASKSPSQPLLRRIKTRKLVSHHLNNLLAALDDTDAHELGPNQCISTFNEALDQSLLKIGTAVKANPSSWPCPEICLLEEYGGVSRAVSRYLPSIGWSSGERIEPLLSAINDLKLPYFEVDIRWLSNGSNSVDSIEKHRSQLESCLIRYLTESSQLMPLPWATKEASVMMQKFTKLELRNSAYYIIPNWVMIFQRLFNWRLVELSNNPISSAYVLAQDDVVSTHRIDRPSVPYLVPPSLDEMVATSYSPPSPETYDDNMDLDALEPYSEVYKSGGIGLMTEGVLQSRSNDSESREDLELATKGSREFSIRSNLRVARPTYAVPSNTTEFSLAPKTVTAADRLSELLDKCNIVQSTIQEKLSIYF